MRTFRFLRGWLRGQSSHAEWARGEGEAVGAGGSAWPPDAPGVRAETRTIVAAPRSGDPAIRGAPPIRARWYARDGATRPLPGWLLLHGAAIQGPDHPALVRLATALASSGAVAMIPEVAEWSRLDLDPAPADPVVKRAAKYMAEDPATAPGGVVLAGFSFGCSQALRLAAELGTTGLLRGVVGFGGYCDLLAAVRFGLTGVYHHDGEPRRAEPDPYGRWVLAANYLHRTPGCEDAQEASAALRTLAREAGERGVMAWEPFYDAMKSELSAKLSPTNRELFRLFAPPAGVAPDHEAAERIAPLIAATALRVHPQLELPPGLDATPLPPVRLVHGRDDPLVPFTETLALERRLRTAASNLDLKTTVTSLFGHARETAPWLSRPVESVRFLTALRDLLALAG